MDAEEVVQEVFLKIWKNKHFLQEEQSFKAFIFTVAKNHIYNLMSKRVSETTYKFYHADAVEQHAYTTEDTLNFDELNNCLQVKVNEMPEKRQQVFIMSRVEGQTNRQIARQLNISLSTVENHLNKALKTLRHYFLFHDINIFFPFLALWL